jgi:hypothetical protein
MGGSPSLTRSTRGQGLKQLGTIGARRTSQMPPVVHSGSSTASDLSVSGSPRGPQNPRMEDETETDEAPRRPTSRGEISHSDEETAFEEEPRSQQRDRATEQPRNVTETTARRPNRGLGLIGGNQKTKAQKPPSLPSPGEDQDLSTDDERPPKTPPQQHRSTPAKRSGKLGVIGGPKAKFSPGSPSTAKSNEAQAAAAPRAIAQPAMNRRPQSPSPAPKRDPEPEPGPQREQTTEEKANQKREELKRRLAVQTQASTKKKRRF